MEVIKRSEITPEDFIKQTLVNQGCEDSGHCKYCNNTINYTN